MSIATTKQLGLCQVGSKTEHPCTHQAVVKIYGMPFCGSCAREQEAYFAMGELTQEAAARDLGDEPLAGMLRGTREERRRARREESNRTLQEVAQEAAWQLFVQEEMRELELQKDGQRAGTLNRMRGMRGTTGVSPAAQNDSTTHGRYSNLIVHP